MNPKPLAATALVLAALLAGCAGTPSAVTHIHFAFGTGHAPIDADVPFPGAPFTARAQLAQWANASGIPVLVESFSFGNCLGKVDGLPATSGCQSGAEAFWSLAVDGNTSMEGMDTLELHAGDRVEWTLTPLSATPAAGAALTLAAAPPAPTRNATIAVSGTVAKAAHLSFSLTHGNATTPLSGLDSKGAWSLEVPLVPGNSTLRITADDGTSTAKAQVFLVRLARGILQVDFKGVPGHAARDDTVWFDPDSRPSESYYEGQKVAHPAYANVHDLMVAWTAQTGVPVVYKAHATLGQQLMQIDGVGDPTLTSSAFWTYKVNGATASFGITDQGFHDGDTIAWHLGP